MRYLCLASCLLEIKDKKIDGDFAELGVFQGNFAKRIHALCPDRHLYLFDTFTGFDQSQFNFEMKTYNLKYAAANNKRFSDTSIEMVIKNIGGNSSFIHPIAGFFPETADTIKTKNFAFVSLDADLYQPMKDGIEFFYPRLTPGGYVMVHDFNSPAYPGTHEAIFEYIKKEHISYVPIPDNCGSIILSKPV